MSSPQQSAGASPAVINGKETAARTLRNYVGGRWIDSTATRFGEVRNPANDELVARVPLGGADDVNRAVEAATRAFPAWRQTPPVNRIKPLFKLKGLLEENAEELARTCTKEHGKTIDESRSSVRRAIDNVDL